MLRAVVDTNVWVSALLNPAGYPARVLEAFRNGRFVPVLRQPLVDELIEVLSRPRLVRKYKLAPDDVAQIVALLLERSESVATQGNIQMCRDPRDDIVLETALTGGASYLVSRDDDIKRDEDLVLSMKLKGVSVLSISDFLARLPEKT
jgi:putative PIN family toxin of toxin-antitoxin system